jgi:hypothetical protein
VSQPVHLDPSRRVLFVDAVIANGESLSGAVDLRSYRLAGVIMPAAWTAAALSFQAAESPIGTFGEAVDSAGAPLAVTAAASQYIVFVAALQEAAAALGVIKVRSGTSGAAVNQAATRTLRLVLVASTK